jgi:tRNA(adenine34) deaminase
MRDALAEAEAAGAAGEFPVGAVVVRSGQVVSRGRSRQAEARSQLAHAELEALQQLRGPEWSGPNPDAVLFTTVEPCPLCLGATVMMDVEHVVFALADRLAGVPEALEIPYVARHILSYVGGVLAAESRALMELYAPHMVERLTGAARGSRAPPD